MIYNVKMETRPYLITGIIILMRIASYATFDPQNMDIFGARVFVENKGQFNGMINSAKKIHYAYDNGDEKIYFTSTGLVYKMIKQAKLTHREMEEIEHGERKALEPEAIYYIYMSWANANKNIQIVESEKQSFHFTYGGPELNASGFKKITYKNVYDNIDIEYVMPADKTHGIKYNIILHQGADPNDIRINYTGDVNKMVLESGQVIIKTPMYDITEHNPKSFISGEKIRTEFTLNKKDIAFSFPNGYDKSQTLTIDPWVTTISNMQSSNYAYDVDFDYAGNTYVYGGYNFHKVAKYLPNGMLDWVFPGFLTNPVWNWGWLSEGMTVNKVTGKTYIAGPLNNGNGGIRVIRLNVQGNYDNFISNGNQHPGEIWRLGYNTNNGEVLFYGGAALMNAVGRINEISGVVTSSFTSPGFGLSDIASHTIDDAGNSYILYSGSPGNGVPSSSMPLANNLILLNTALTNTVWMQYTGYPTMKEACNKSYYVNSTFTLSMMNYTVSSNTFNCLTTNCNYIFYYDGLNLAAFNKLTGAKIATVTVNGNNLLQQGGIAVDDCNNIYLGGNGSILCFNFNGNTFNQLASIPINSNSSLKYVYDIKINKTTNLLHVCGSQFVGTYNAIHSGSCSVGGVTSQYALSTVCQGTAGTAAITITTSVSSPTFNYVWSQGSTTVSSTNNSTSYTNTAGGLSNGIYTVQVFYNSPCGGIVIYTNTVNINCVNICSVAPSASIICPNGGSVTSFSLFANNPGGFRSSPSYTWTGPGSFNSNLQNPSFPNGAFGVYSVTASNGSCTYNGTVQISNPIIIPTVTPMGTITCVTNATAIATPTISSGYSYSWNGTGIVGSSTGQAVTGGTLGVYSCTITHISSGCSASANTALVEDKAVLSATVTPAVSNISCSGGPITFTGSPAPVSNYTYQWYIPCGPNLSGYLCSPGCAGIYTFEITNTLNGCKSVKTSTATSINTIPSLTISATGQNYNITCTKCVTMQIQASITGTASGGIGVYWLDATGTNTISGSNTFITCAAGNYFAKAINLTAPSCSVSQMVTILENKIKPDAGFVSQIWGTQNPTLTCNDPCVILTATSTVTSYTAAWRIPATIPDATISVCTTTNQNQSVAVVYSVQITDLINGCQSTSVVPVYQNIKTVALTAKATPSLLTCTVIQSQLSFLPNPLNASFTFTWITPPPTANIPQINPISVYSPGTYSIGVTNDENGCISYTTVVLGVNNLPPSINVVPDATIACGTSTVQISSGVTSTIGNTYYWDGPNGSAITPITGQSPKVDQTGTYTVIITNTLTGCRNLNWVNVVAGALTVTFTADPSQGYAPLQTTFVNQSTPGSSSYWGYGNGTTLSSTTTINGNTTYNSPGTYTVILISQKGICIDSAQAIVIVDIPSKLEVPNVFTPNGDGVNDVFLFRAANLKEINIHIYDRWGIKVYEVNTENGNVLWDGKNLSGNEVTDGTYFYALKAKGNDGKDYNLEGNVTLFR